MDANGKQYNGRKLNGDILGEEERRWSPRRDLKIDVVLLKQGTPMARGRSRDVGLEGMFVEAEVDDVTKDSLVDVEFVLDDGVDRSRHRMAALVVHVAREGFGLMFLRFNRRVFRLFEHMLYA